MGNQSEGFPSNEFCQYIKDRVGPKKDCKIEQGYKFKAWPRFIFVNQKGDYWIILMLTLKSPKGTIVANQSADGVLKFIANNPIRARTKSRNSIIC